MAKDAHASKQRQTGKEHGTRVVAWDGFGGGRPLLVWGAPGTWDGLIGWTGLAGVDRRERGRGFELRGYQAVELSALKDHDVFFWREKQEENEGKIGQSAADQEKFMLPLLELNFVLRLPRAARITCCIRCRCRSFSTQAR